ncbi:AVN_HP_G0118460.mRNA.1.CDS.1 [Saccharomyces cerevisiae]|nr:AVN_HP_G0126790.mRNA.1.CDS.1 [Saccharomyces cerevisiae]CAI4959741.1 BEM_HP_G0150720.mRNA.1.CDS.1 [Saccharomyces cerevisiae]CAI4987373.1 BEM_HP_G0170680.mRNA.1.CDS.1 [Saccharomyces cerevisiae]CAI5000225.1 BEM_HP_G0011840.mRNA.1.CDS.1 [Saccharomyces cerevisiae]CAI5165519.1 AVN_HP_G0118460.mRNA.1.CDS.1 [Saccharomyces cerevisiae]
MGVHFDDNANTTWEATDPGVSSDCDGQHRVTESIQLQNFSNTDMESMLDEEGRENSKPKWLLLKRKHPIQKFIERVWNGPVEPSDEPPSFPKRWGWLKKIDDFPQTTFKTKIPSKLIRLLLLIVYCCFWMRIFYSLIYPYLIKPPYFHPNDGSEKIPILSLSCNSYLNWEGTNNECGLNAKNCGPLDNKEYMIRCPALCDRGGWTYSAIAVGNRRVKYTGYEIGGGALFSEEDPMVVSYPYRSDSFPCASAVHAGVISPFYGGCTKVSMQGAQNSFPSKKGMYNTGFSVAFNSFFPGSYSFRDIQGGILSGCYDPRAAVVALNMLFGLPIFYLYDSIYGYWINTIVGYWTLVLSLDPPLLTDAHDPASVYELFSVGFQRLLPLCFVLYVVWKSAVKRTLENGSPIAKVILWYPTFWLGISNNVTFDRLPVDRLTTTDLKEQAGALTAVGSIAATILTCAVIQAYSLWKSGRFKKYFKIYICFIGGLIALGSLPGLNLRIHHYILGSILVPGCATRGSSAYLFQGILVGLILSGVARWDFASIVETDTALLRGEAGASLKPPILDFNDDQNHSLSWHLNATDPVIDQIGNIDGFSLLLNDVEVYVGKNETVSIDVLRMENPALAQMMDDALDASNGTIDLYLRVARASVRSPTNRGDYTNAGVLQWPNGMWQKPEPGVS